MQWHLNPCKFVWQSGTQSVAQWVLPILKMKFRDSHMHMLMSNRHCLQLMHAYVYDTRILFLATLVALHFTPRQ